MFTELQKMYANYKPHFDRDGRKKNLREGLPAYAYSRYLPTIYYIYLFFNYISFTRHLIKYQVDTRYLLILRYLSMKWWTENRPLDRLNKKGLLFRYYQEVLNIFFHTFEGVRLDRVGYCRSLTQPGRLCTYIVLK